MQDFSPSFALRLLMGQIWREAMVCIILTTNVTHSIAVTRISEHTNFTMNKVNELSVSGGNLGAF